MKLCERWRGRSCATGTEWGRCCQFTFQTLHGTSQDGLSLEFVAASAGRECNIQDARGVGLCRGYWKWSKFYLECRKIGPEEHMKFGKAYSWTDFGVECSVFWKHSGPGSKTCSQNCSPHLPTMYVPREVEDFENNWVTLKWGQIAWKMRFSEIGPWSQTLTYT